MICYPGNNRIVYSYDAAGNKRKQEVYDEFHGKKPTTTTFIGNFVFLNGALMWQNYDEGRVVYNKGLSVSRTEVFLKDHLGNVRVVYDNSTGEPVQHTNFYPFGMQMYTPPTLSATININEYLYNGKMYQDELGLGWYDYGARFYDGVIGRWWVVDPMAEKYYLSSSYHYSSNNPIKYVEIDGRNFDDYKLLLNGNIQKMRTTNSSTDNLYSSKANGAVDLSKKVTVTKGTFDNSVDVQPLSKSGGGCSRSKVDGVGDGYSISNAKDAVNMFVFASDNSNVEFGLIETNSGESVVMTNHSSNKISASRTAKKMDESGMQITTITHSHPSNSDPSSTDISNVKNFSTSQGRDVNYNVYQPDKKSIVGYNSKGNLFTILSKTLYDQY